MCYQSNLFVFDLKESRHLIERTGDGLLQAHLWKGPRKPQNWATVLWPGMPKGSSGFLPPPK